LGYPEERRGRSRRESLRLPQEPPEIIAVEMTPEEQEVYAWMGISPLVLSHQDVKNPKAAIISVVLPGEAPAPTIEPEQMTLTSQLEPVAMPSKPKQRVVEPDVEPEPEPAPAMIDQSELFQPEVDDRPSSGLEAVDTSDLDAVDANGTPIMRRRRRRSSAATSD